MILELSGTITKNCDLNGLLLYTIQYTVTLNLINYIYVVVTIHILQYFYHHKQCSVTMCMFIIVL